MNVQADMDLDVVLNDCVSKYPSGGQKLKKEIKKLKQNLGVEGFKCDICHKIIQHRSNFNRHVKAHETAFKCFLCDRKFNRRDSLQRHERGHLVGYKPPDNTFTCQQCGMGFNTYTSLFDHSQTTHPVQVGGGNVNTINHKTSMNSALEDSVNVLTIFPSDQDKYDLLTFFYNIRSEINRNLLERTDKVKHIKWYLNVHVEFMRETLDGENSTSQPYFASSTYILLPRNDLSDTNLNEAFQKQFKSIDEYIARGSGWSLKHVIHMEVHTIQYRPLGGSTYFPIPKTLQRSHAVINIMNQDEKCFLWSILAHLHPVTNNPSRVSHYTAYEGELNMKGITYPMQVKHIPKFENQNDISVNVIGFEDNEFFPIYISKRKDKRYEVDLLYLTKTDGAHYCYIKHLNRLLSRTKQSGRAYKFCWYCLRGCTSQRVLDKHIKYCSQHDAQHVEFPTRGDGDIVEFDDFSKQMRVPFVIYCDFEAFAIPCSQNPTTSHTTTTANFDACGYGYHLVCVDERYSKPPVIYRGENACKHLIESLLEEEKYIREVLDKIEPLNMTQANEEVFRQSTHCFICNDPFTETSGKVRDHCHISGKFHGAACSNCNLNYKHPSFIPVYFHNLRGFDSHLLMQGVGLFKNRRISCIPNNMERYVSS